MDPINSLYNLVPRRYHVIQIIINSNSFYSLGIPRRYYVIQIIINSNSFYILVPRRYYVLHKIRVHEVDGQPPASSYIRHCILMYELAGDFTKK